MVKYLTPKELSGLVGCSERTLAKWRWEGTGPRFIKLSEARGGRVLYRDVDIDAWMAARVRGGDTEQAAS